jgi:hypothetical protein
MENCWSYHDPNPGKDLSEVESYRPISLLPNMSKLFEKLILKRLKPIITEKYLEPMNQFGFRSHSSIDQVHLITKIIFKTFDNKGVCSAVFLDFAQAFDRVRHRSQFFPVISIKITEILFNQSTFSFQTWKLVLRTEVDEGWCPTGKCIGARFIGTLY